MHSGTLLGDIHDRMAMEVAKFHETFDNLVQNFEPVIGPIRNLLKHIPSMHLVFLSLNTDDKTIGDIITNEDPSGELKNIG